jgi:uncharacterized protein (TIGR02246 family)
MVRLSVVGSVVVFFLSLTGCTQTPHDPSDTRAADQKAISDGEIAWVADWKSKDIEKIVSHYADDAILMETGMPAMKGKEAIRSGLRVFLADKNLALTFAPTGVEASKGGDLAHSYGTYTATMTDAETGNPVTETGKYVCVYRKQSDGSWKSILDINNPDAPAK